MSIRMFTGSKMLPQLGRAPIHDAVFASEGMPPTWTWDMFQRRCIKQMLNTSLMPSAFTHKGLGEQLHAMLCVFPPAKLQKTPIWNICLWISVRLPQGAYQLKGRPLLTRVESIWRWLPVRRVDLRLRAVGQGCLTIPLPIQNAPT